MIDKNGLKISLTLYEFINREAISGTDINIDVFWQKFSDAVHELSPVNKSLVKKRESIQQEIE